MHNPRPGGGDIVEMSSSAAAAPPHEGAARERVIPHSGPLSKKTGARKSARFAESVSAPLTAPPPRAASPASNDDDDYVEITLDVRDDTVAVHSVKPAHGVGAGGDDSDQGRAGRRASCALVQGLEFQGASYTLAESISQCLHLAERITSIFLHSSPILASPSL